MNEAKNRKIAALTSKSNFWFFLLKLMDKLLHNLKKSTDTKKRMKKGKWSLKKDN
jgi:hypothetical protein